MPAPTDAPAPDAALGKVADALEALVGAAQAHGGLFPSLLDRRRARMLEELPPAIPGQRVGDRAFLGSNLVHDEPTLATLLALGPALGRPALAEAADACLRRFATHCTGTATGLFPWGEHSFWQLVEDRVGNGTHNVNPAYRGSAVHDHLRQAPPWLWEKLHGFHPPCVARFAEGLDYHWVEGGRDEYNRHGNLDLPAHWPRNDRNAGPCDFPRHGGFYVLDWAFAWSKTGRADFLRQARDMLAYWQARREPSGLLPLRRGPASSGGPSPLRLAPGQTLSFGVSLFEAAGLLEAREPSLAAEMRRDAGACLDGFLAAPHDPARGVFLIQCGRDPAEPQDAMPVWGSRYGLWPASYVALTALRGHALSGRGGLLAWAEAVARAYAATPFPGDTRVPAMDAGLALGLFAELHALTRKDEWLSLGRQLGATLLRAYFDDAPLPRGAAGVDWYESQMGPGFLLHGLARLALLQREGPAACPLEADFTAR
jgi:hypothetical protein